MSRVADMRSLTENLVRSHDERMANIAARRANVANGMKENRQRIVERHAARMEEAAELHRELADCKTARTAAVSGMVADLSRERAEMAAAQSSSLAKATADRRPEVDEMRAQTQRAMREVQANRAAGEAALKAELHRERVDFIQQFSDLMSNIQQAHANMADAQRENLAETNAKLKLETANFLGEASAAHSAMAKAQRESLEAGQAALHAQVSATLAGFHSARQELAADLAQFSHAWQNFANVMQARRAGIAPSPPPPEAKPAPTKAAKASPSAPHAPPQTRAQAQEAPSDEDVFSYLADHPDGVRLIELEAHFGTPRIRLVPTITRLIEQNKARKDEELKLYFAT
ncbi:MAG: hypothetical protein HY675_02435 [Chloroflexi bacterium]|nr:hypothetical protein [Chloroflexota bacterium]